jgi:SRSO17 transposase
MDMAVGQVARPWRGVGQWVDAVTELHGRIAHRFARSEVRERARRYLVGLLERVERKNGWQLAEAIGEVGPRGVQRLLSAATWDADAVRDDLRVYVIDHLGDPASGVLIIDDTGFVKKGDKSCGVGRQYTGTVGRWLEEQGRAYAVMVPNTHAVRYAGRRQTAAKLAARLPHAEWRTMTIGAGSLSEDRQVWACLPLSEPCAPGMQRWLLIRRSGDDGEDLAYFLAFGAANVSEAELLRVCGVRWQIEECFAQAKGDVGLDQYEVRTWDAWHRFVTLCLLAHAGLVVMRQAANQHEAEEKGAAIPA